MPPSQSSRGGLRRGKSSSDATGSGVPASGGASGREDCDGGLKVPSGLGCGEDGGERGRGAGGGSNGSGPPTPQSRPLPIEDPMRQPHQSLPLPPPPPPPGSHSQQPGYQQQQSSSDITQAYIAYPASYPPQPMNGDPSYGYWSHFEHAPPPPHAHPQHPQTHQPLPPQRQPALSHQGALHRSSSRGNQQPTVPIERGRTDSGAVGKEGESKGWEGKGGDGEGLGLASPPGDGHTRSRIHQQPHQAHQPRSHPYYHYNASMPQYYQPAPPSQYYIPQLPYYYDQNGTLQLLQTPSSGLVDSGYWSGGSTQGYPSNPRMMMAPPAGYCDERSGQGTMAPGGIIPPPPTTMTTPTTQFRQNPWGSSGNTTSVGEGTSGSAEGNTPMTDEYDGGPQTKDMTMVEEEREVMGDMVIVPDSEESMDDVVVVKDEGEKKATLAGVGHISRPPNAWILYRSDKLRSIAAGERIPSNVRAQAVEESGGDTDASTEPGATEGESSSAPAQEGHESKKRKKKKKKPAAATVALHAALEADAAKASKEGSKGMPQADISKLISLMWKGESKAVKAQYEELANAKKAEHQAMYPDYKYQPMKKEDKDRLKLEKEQEKKAARREKAEKAKLKPRRSRAKPKLPNALNHYPLLQSQVRDAGPEEGGSLFNYPSSFPPGREMPRAISFSALPGLLSPRARKASRRTVAATSPHSRDEQLDMHALDASQVYWGVPPKLRECVEEQLANTSQRDPLPATSGPAQISQISFLPLEQQQHPHFRQAHGLDEMPVPAPAGEMEADGWATEWQDPQWRQSQRQQELLPHGEQDANLHQEGPGGQPLPPPELCYAVDFDPNTAVPYIFEPMAVYSNGQPVSFMPILDGEYADTPPNGEMSYGPLAGVSASDLTEMWCLLEEEEGSKGQQPHAGNSAPVPDWMGDADTALGGWAELGVSYDGEGAPAIELSSDIAKEIASNWATESSHQHQQDAGRDTSAPMQSGEVSGGHQPPILSYERPGYLTIQVPINSLESSFGIPGGGMALHGQDALLSSVTPLSPEGPVFAMDGMGSQQSIGQRMDGAMVDGNTFEDRNSIGTSMPVTPSFESFGDNGSRFASNSAYPAPQVDEDDFTDPGWARNPSGISVARSRQLSGMFGMTEWLGAEKHPLVAEVQSWPPPMDKDFGHGTYIAGEDDVPLAVTTNNHPVGSGGGGRGRRARTVAAVHK